MPNYAYTIKDATGSPISGTSEAESEDILRKRLTEQGFAVLDVKQVKSAQKKVGGFGGVKKTELSVMCRQFSTMIDAGVNLVRCLNVLTEQATSPKLKAILTDVRTEVEGGSTLTRALEKYPTVFDRLFLGLVNAGESGRRARGKSSEAFAVPGKGRRAAPQGQVGHDLPGDDHVFRHAGRAPAYDVRPAQVSWACSRTWESRSCLPRRPYCRAAATSYLSDWYWAIIIIVIFVVALRLFLRTKVGRRVFDKIKLKAPVFGKLNHKVSLARFSRTLATLLASGVPILQALETVAGTVSNDIISDAIMEARARIREGDKIAEPLAKSRLFPPMVTQMISIGEESGSLDPMLSKVADFYESEVDAALESLTAAIEPVLIVTLGIVVGFIVISLFLPLVAVIQNLSGGESGATKQNKICQSGLESPLPQFTGRLSEAS